MQAPWVTFRPEIKVLDGTIRDGGLINDHRFDDDLVKAVYEACVAAGLDYMEIGYRNSKRIFPRERFGPFRHSDEEDRTRRCGACCWPPLKGSAGPRGSRLTATGGPPWPGHLRGPV